MKPSASAEARPLRIAHVITRLVNGGADENTVISCNYAARAGHHVSLIHGAITRPEVLATLDPAVDVIRIDHLARRVSPIADARALRDLSRVIRRLQPDVIHTHTSKAGILGRLAARRARVAVVVHGVHILPFQNVNKVERAVYRSAERAIQGFTDVYVDVSHELRSTCIAAGVGTPDRHHVVRSGFDLSAFRAADPPEGWRELLGLGPDDPHPPILVMMAAFEPRKSHLELLERFPRIVAACPDVRLVLVGEGALRPQIEARIAALGITRNVVLTGFRSNPEQFIALADIGLMASRREGLPRVVMQCLVAGKPVVATDLPGIREVLTDDVNGLVTPLDDLDAFVAAVVALLTDSRRLNRLAAGAAATDLQEWDERRMADRLVEIYASVLAGHRRLMQSHAPAPSEARA